MTLRIDRRIYSDECISKAIYALAARYSFKRSLLSEVEEELIVIPQTDTEESTVKADVFDSLNDFKLRCIIDKETHDIRTILYAKAFSDCEDIDETDLD
jgi:His-Xaa-Ser system protein HxsD